MIQCPECRSMIPDDSAFCDQCGKELKWCPECKRPKRGTQCPLCGSDLVPGRKYLAGDLPKAPQPVEPPQETVQDKPVQNSPAAEPQRTSASVPPVAPVGKLVGNGWNLLLQAGDFGRRGGMWPELSTCQYVSGSHGRIVGTPGAWKIVDVGSTNGTFVNGRRLATGEECPLQKGDKIRIATLDFTVE